LWLLEELGVPYECVKTDFAAGATRTPEFLAINPNGHVPALEDGDVKLFESLAINLYLARRYDDGRGFWPSDVADEGRTWQWTIWAMTELEEPIVTALVHRSFLPEAQRDPRKAEQAEKRHAKRLAVLDGALAGRTWLVGDGFSVADLNVASVLWWSSMASLPVAQSPHAAAWLERCTSRPALARALAA
jgi:glutathione S-transferase